MQNPMNVKKRLDEKGVYRIYALTNGGKQQLIFIDEPNLYRCIFRSDKKKAKEFQDWVFNEVLPSIRTTGGYIATKQDDTPESIMARAIIVVKGTMEMQRQHIKELENENAILTDINDGLRGSCMSLAKELKERNAAAEYANTVLKSTTTWNTGVIAKGYGMSAVALNKNSRGSAYSTSSTEYGSLPPTTKGWATSRCRHTTTSTRKERRAHACKTSGRRKAACSCTGCARNTNSNKLKLHKTMTDDTRTWKACVVGWIEGALKCAGNIKDDSIRKNVEAEIAAFQTRLMPVFDGKGETISFKER